MSSGWRRQRSAKAVEITAWAQLAAAYADPYAEAAVHIMAERRADKALLDASAALPGSQVVDVCLRPFEGAQVEHLVDAKLAWGMSRGDIAALVVQQGARRPHEAEGRVRSSALRRRVGGHIPRFAGVPLMVMTGRRSRRTAGEYSRCSSEERARSLVAQTRRRRGQGHLKTPGAFAMHVYWVAHRYLRTRRHAPVVKIVLTGRMGIGTRDVTTHARSR